MRTLIAVLTALTLLAPLATAQVPESFYTPVTDHQQISDEPNAPAEGVAFRWAPPGSPARSYGESRQAFQDALAGTPTLVIDARPNTRMGINGGFDFTGLWALKPFTGRDFLLPATNVRVLYGVWGDANGDTFVQDAELQGRGDTTLMQRAAGPDEFLGVEGAKIVSYVTGYHWSQNDFANGRVLHGKGSGVAPWEQYNDIGGGYYHSLIRTTGVTGTLPPDNELLVTHVMETYEGFQDTTSPDRTWKLVPGKPVDLDIYSSVDPNVETLFAGSFRAIQDREQPINDTIWGPNLEPLVIAANDADNGLDQFIGPAEALVLVVVPNDVRDALGSNPHAYHENWHPWLNIVGRIGIAAPTPSLIISGSTFAVSPTATGQEGIAPGVFYPRIAHGAWFDVNNDGFITDGDNTKTVGSEEPSPGCDDLFDCGDNPEPNEYNDDIANTAVGNREYKEVCASEGVNWWIEPMTADGSWPGGVFVFGPDGEGDRDDETGPIVRDASDGNVDRLVLNGRIDATSSCNASNSPFQYFSDHKIIFPAGNPTFGVRFGTEEKCTDMSIVGIPQTECTIDTDELAAWV